MTISGWTLLKSKIMWVRNQYAGLNLHIVYEMLHRHFSCVHLGSVIEVLFIQLQSWKTHLSTKAVMVYYTPETFVMVIDLCFYRISCHHSCLAWFEKKKIWFFFQRILCILLNCLWCFVYVFCNIQVSSLCTLFWTHVVLVNVLLNALSLAHTPVLADRNNHDS